MQNPIKNTIIIQIDSESDRQIQITKPASIPRPTNREETSEMLLTDITCVAQALKSLISVAGNNGYADKNELINACIKTLYEALETSDKTASEQPSN
jgi:IS30 family transposase